MGWKRKAYAAGMSLPLARARRLDLSFPLRFEGDCADASGHCMNVSESGLLARFDRPMEVWDVGELSLHFGEKVLLVRAKVARVNENEAGLAFLLRGEADRLAVEEMVAFATAKTQLHDDYKPPF